MALATAYAENEDFEEYVEGWATSDADALTRLLSRASDDVDSILGAYDFYESGDYAGRKLDPTTLTYSERRALVRATCAQVHYRFEMGEDFFTRPSVATSGPEFSMAQPASHVSPQTWRELAGSGLVRNTTSAQRGRAIAPPWGDFARNIEAD